MNTFKTFLITLAFISGLILLLLGLGYIIMLPVKTLQQNIKYLALFLCLSLVFMIYLFSRASTKDDYNAQMGHMLIIVSIVFNLILVLGTQWKHIF